MTVKTATRRQQTNVNVTLYILLYDPHNLEVNNNQNNLKLISGLNFQILTPEK